MPIAPGLPERCAGPVTLRRSCRNPRRPWYTVLMAVLARLYQNATWPLFAVLVSSVMLGAAHAFERFGGLAPCPLCLRQREVYWALIAMTVTGLVIWQLVPKRRFLVALNILIGLVFGVGVIVAAYHAGVEWRWFPPPTGCSAGPGIDPSLPINLDQKFNIVSCVDAPFYILGLSMAGWNGVVSLVLSGVSFFAAWKTLRPPMS
jgi:disulfide bond formation protein DsbB